MRAEPRDRWRGHVKAALASAITGVHEHGLGALLARRPVTPLILGYHRVVDDFASAARIEMPSMLIGRDMFERHLDCLARHFRFVTLDEIGEHLAGGEPFDEPVVAVTFDDGYRDVYEQAFPALRRRGIPAAMFVVTDIVGRPFWQHHDRLYRLMAKAYTHWEDPRRELRGLLHELDVEAESLLAPRTAMATPLTTVSALLPGLPQASVNRLLESLESAVGNGFGPAPETVTWQMLSELRDAGWVIGSHSETHPALPTESPSRIADEVEGSKQALERELGGPITHFAYPGGYFSRPVVEAIDRAGYRFAYTASPHGDAEHPALAIERLLLWEGSSVDADGRFSENILSCQALGLWPPARVCRVHHV